MEKLSKNTTFFQKLKKIFFPFYKSKDIKKLFSIIEKGQEKIDFQGDRDTTKDLDEQLQKLL